MDINYKILKKLLTFLVILGHFKEFSSIRQFKFNSLIILKSILWSFTNYSSYKKSYITKKKKNKDYNSSSNIII